MAVVQVSDLFLNNQKRFTEALVATIPAKQSDGNARTGSAPEYVKGGDGYTAYCIPKNSIVSKFSLVVREAFDASTTVTVTTGGGLTLFTDADVASVALIESSVAGTWFDETDSVILTFSQDVTKGVVQLVGDYLSLDEKSGKYTNLAPLTV